MRGQQRMPAEQSKKLSSAPTRSTRSTARPNLGQLPLQSGARRYILLHTPRPKLRPGNAPQVGLAVRRQRQHIHPHNRRWTPCTRAGALSDTPATQPDPPRLRTASDHIGGQSLVARHVFPHHDHTALANCGCAASTDSISPKLNAEAANLHLIVDPPAILQFAIGRRRAKSPVSYKRRPLNSIEWIGNKAFVGQFRTMQIAASNSRAADIHLACTPIGTGCRVSIQAHTPAGQGSARRSRLPAACCTSAIVDGR